MSNHRHIFLAGFAATLLAFLEFSGSAQADPTSNSFVVPNAGFEEWQDGKPAGWTVNKGHAFLEDRLRMRGARSIKLLVDRKTTDKWPTTEITSDLFRLEPNTSYKLSAWVSVIGEKHEAKFEVIGVDGILAGSYESFWIRNHPWMQISTSFRTRAAKEYRLCLGAASGATVNTSVYGEPMWVDHITIEKDGGTSVGSDPVDNARGFSLFTRSIMTSLDIDTKVPTPAEMADTLKVRLARGEYEPVMLGLFALKDLQDVDVRVAGDLTGPGGARIAKKDVVIRRLVKEVLPITRPRNIKANEILAWWATVKSEKDTAPGIYRGNLEIVASGAVVHALPFEAEVLDITLPAPEIAFWTYHCESFFPKEFLTAELRKMYYRDMVEHGMNTVSVYNNADVDGSGNIDWAHNTATLKDNHEYPFGLDTIVPWILESGLCAAGQPLFYLPSRGYDVGKSHGYGWGGVPKDALKATLDGWRERGWPELVLYCGDEPGSRTGLVPRLKMVKSWFPSIRLTTAGIEPDALGKYYDVWIQGEAGIDQRTMIKAEELGTEVWAYNCTAPNTNMPFARAFYGFWAYKTGVKGVAEWAYYDLGRWTADENGDVFGDSHNRHSRVIVSPIGPIPTISWEATREGIDDYRHIQMLRDLVKSAGEHQKVLAAQAEKLLSKEAREIIDKREKQQFTKFDPDKPEITWKAANAKQAKGERIYLASRELEKEVEYARIAHQFVIEPIPFDSMVTRTGMNYHMPKWSRWCPPMGPGGVGDNPVTITEDKRKVVASYILYLQDVLKRAK